MSKKPEPWDLQSSTHRGDYHIFRVREDVRVSPVTGEALKFSILETNDWINVLPLTTDGQVILIRQWRHGRNELTWEIPGGLIDPGEEPVAAAGRELREETGYAAGRIQYAGAVTPNPAFITNRCHACIAYDCEIDGEPNFDIGEDIETCLMSLDKVLDMIKSGEIHHALVVAAIYLCTLQMKR